MEQLVVGILAHVDAGKTTLSEGLLYRGGQLKKLGRVDHRDAFLDTETLERERGITIFAKQAILPLAGRTLTLLDTPGHVDFAAETERTLQVLDCAILVVSGTDGVQAHTLTLWRLLRRHRVPTFLFLNKMDLPGPGRAALLAQLKTRLDDGCADFSGDMSAVWETAATCDEGALDTFLETGALPEDTLRALISDCRLFPCFFGSALRLEGVDALLRGLETWAPRPVYPQEFGARVYKISRDPQGTRLTHLKVTGGALGVKDLLTGPGWAEKADQLRLYSGPKFQAAETVPAGGVCAVAGLSQTYPGQGLGGAAQGRAPVLESALTYGLVLPRGCDPHTALQKLRLLEEEDPQLRLTWSEATREICLQLMGEIQLEVLTALIARRFGLEVSFTAGRIAYRETIASTVEGVGHFEPLRHYAEVHLLLEPGEPGSGLTVASACPEDVLDRAWQRLVLTHLEERSHPGVLTGAPITDLRITLIAGRGHLKHTEGGDFRQATYRAVRQGLRQAESVLLEPWYDFTLELPVQSVGRAMSDLQRMGGVYPPPETLGETARFAGRAPVAALGDYAREVAAYTRGLGRLSCASGGYEPCHNTEAVVAETGYDPDRDAENPCGSVFCAHGAGFHVPWDQVKAHMHVESPLTPSIPPEPEPEAPAPRRGGGLSYAGAAAQDKELQAIFERTYGPVKARAFRPTERPPAPETPEKRTIQPRDLGPEYLLVDGYNIIHSWPELKGAAAENLDAARQLLMDLLVNYHGFRPCELILVFDAYKVPRSVGEVSGYHGIHVVYTKEAETADNYIEKTTYQLGKKYRVRVATSDGVEQLIILGHGALRLSATAFRAEVEAVSGQISALLERNNRPTRSQPVRAALEKARERKDSPS